MYVLFNEKSKRFLLQNMFWFNFFLSKKIFWRLLRSIKTKKTVLNIQYGFEKRFTLSCQRHIATQGGLFLQHQIPISLMLHNHLFRSDFAVAQSDL